MISRSANSMCSSSSLPASIFEKSRMSLMISSRPSAERVMVSARRRCRARELGALQQLGHSHDAVHRRADLVAHAREKLALRAARPLRGLLGRRRFGDRALELAVGVAEVDRALGDLLLEELPVSLEPRVALANLAQHLVEALDQRADLVLGAAFDPQRVILFGRHALHRLREVHDGAGYLMLQPGGDPVGADQRRGQSGEGREQEGEPVGIDGIERRDDQHRAEDLAVGHGGGRDPHMTRLQRGRRALPRIERHGRRKLQRTPGSWRADPARSPPHRRPAAVGREDAAVGQRDLHAARLRLLPQRVQRLDGALVVAGLERLDDVHAGDVGDARGKAAQLRARMQHIRDHGHDHRQREGGDRRRSDHDAELALDREVRKPANQRDLHENAAKMQRPLQTWRTGRLLWKMSAF